MDILAPLLNRPPVRLDTAAASVFGGGCAGDATAAVRTGLALSDLLYFGPLVMFAAVASKGQIPDATRALLWRGGAFAAAGGAIRLGMEAHAAKATCAAGSRRTK